MPKRRKTVKFFGRLETKTYYPLSELAFKSMKYCVLIAILLVAAPQIGCLPGGALSKADKLAEDKDYHGAIEAYQSVVDTQPGTPVALQAQFAIGTLFIKQMNRPAEGIKAYEAVIAAAPKSDEAAEAHYELGMHHYREKDYKAAQTQFDAIVNNFPQLELSQNAHLMLAKSYEDDQSFEQAAETFDSFANRNPRSKRAALALENKARIQHQHLKDEEEAKRTNQLLVKRYGKIEGAEESVEKAKQVLKDFNATIPEPDDPLATQQGRALAQFEARRERDRPRGSVERSPAMGNANVEIADSGFGISAADVMRNFGGQTGIAGDDQGSYHAAELMIANFFYGDESYRDAGALYFDAITRAEAAKDKIDPYTYLKLSVCYRKVGMHQRAKEVLRKAASRDGKVVEAIINTGRNHYTSENYEQAIETYNSVIGMSRSKDSEIYWLISLAHKKLGEPEKEREVLERSVAANTQNTDALQSLAEVLHYRLKDRKTAAIFQDLVDQKGDSYIGAKTLGDLTYQYGNYVQARARYKAAARIAKRVLDKSESDVEKRELRNQIVYATILAARATYQLNKPEDAQQIIDELAAEYPEHALIPYSRGELALLNGDTETAVAEFKAAIEKDPNSDIPVIALGDYYVSQGYNDDAIALWEGFLTENQYNQNVRRSLKKLKGDAEEPKE
ncbi:tetratricopeptide repeat protein [Candidatus Poribacteria bacterium]|nr:tetratricopeptide repeat protein [Candidatus Poribacteria bacterium]MYH83736.1 tetratricopeptide repeat protein [Candidatus Poribacteria bacterium]MYK96712.1 tetratricopeptide repeat protein [Candidatus Poribacteria bacterium]